MPFLSLAPRIKSAKSSTGSSSVCFGLRGGARENFFDFPNAGFGARAGFAEPNLAHPVQTFIDTPSISADIGRSISRPHTSQSNFLPPIFLVVNII
jgi:hypothetical protein